MDFLTNMLSYVGWVLLAIMILVFVHELGHFLFAKLFKMRVEKFSIGFPPKIIGRQIGETEYVVGLTPLGGYVKISGMVDESMDTDALAEEAKPWEFRAKPVWQRMLVITGGVAFNLILAAFVFMGLKAFYGQAYTPRLGPVLIQEESVAYEMGLRTGDRILKVNGLPATEQKLVSWVEEILLSNSFNVQVERAGEVMSFTGPPEIMTRLNESGGDLGVSFQPPIIGDRIPGSVAEAAGLLAGDWILSVDGDNITYWDDFTKKIVSSDGRDINLRWRRPDSLAAVFPPGATLVDDSLGRGLVWESTIQPADSGGRFVIGVYPLVRLKTYSLSEAVVGGIVDTWSQTRLVAVSLARVFTGRENFRANVGGPIAIAKATKEAADMGAPFFWNIVALLSITLAIINILPVPALDGGHLVFLIYEGIVRREPSLRFRMISQQVGMVILLAFMAFVIFNDILKL
jgi:regulator of sigma E protease